MHYGIGIDTGGTYTDAVLYDFIAHRIVATVKVPTTRHDVSIAVSRAVEKLLGSGGTAPDGIGLLAVSTTLATNAIVEKKGARVGLIVIGTVRQFSLPVAETLFIKGGHTVIGNEDDPLDLEALVDSLGEIRNRVECYAVCAAMSMVNSTHELVAEKAVGMIDPGKPVFCSHRACDDAGMEARAATVSLHAALMPIMDHFIKGVERSMQAVGLHCPLAVISGNGRIVTREEALHKAAVTMASGPASAAWFSARHTHGDALVVDVGGTTTDVCMVRDSRPLLAAQGCRIKEWQTHIETVDMVTRGIGGDSLVICTPAKVVEVMERRVQPLAMTAGLEGMGSWMSYEPQQRYLVMAAGEDDHGDELIGFLLENGPVTPAELKGISNRTGIALEKHLEWLAYKNRITMIGFTPTDALHVLGMLDIGNREEALRGAEMLARLLVGDKVTPESLSRMVLAETRRKIERCIVEFATRRIWGEAAAVVADRTENDLVTVSYSLKVPIVALGAAARFFLPGVGERLGCEVIYPENFEVGSAVGAILAAGGGQS